MSSNDWYSPEEWYAPNSDSTTKKKKKKRGWTKVRIGGIIVLTVLLITASSLIFAYGRDDLPGESFSGGIPAIQDPGKMPDSMEEFFESYYESITSTVMKLDIPQAALPIDFDLELQAVEEFELSLTELYSKCAPSITAITGYVDDDGYSWGTGVVLSESGLILTNAHVIDGCNRVEVTCFDDSVYEAKLVGADSISDLAVLKISARGLVPAQFGDSSMLQVGEPVAAIGNPLGETFRTTLTDGIISAIERDISYNGHSMSLLQTNTAINEGNSGGALFNMYGQVIGITNMKMMSSYSSIEGIGFAIPSSMVQKVVDSLVVYGRVQGRPSIGITVGGIPDNAAKEYNLPEGLYVSAVTESSDAYKKGIRPGDVLLEVNGIPVSSTDEVNAIKEGLQVGETMEFLIWRDGQSMVFEVELMDTNDIYG